MFIKPRLVACLLALTTLVAVATPALALARVTRLAVSTSPEASGITSRLPLETEVAYVIFDYEGASNEKLTVSIEGLGLSTIVAKSGTYSGNGTATVQFTGAEVFQALVARVAVLASQAQSDVKRAAEQELGRALPLSGEKANAPKRSNNRRRTKSSNCWNCSLVSPGKPAEMSQVEK